MTRANFPMPFKAPLLLILPALTAVLHAGVPQKQPLGNYANLWTNSPFTEAGRPSMIWWAIARMFSVNC